MANTLYNIIHQVHEIWSYLIGPRQRCPNCGTIGYWRAYGGWISLFIGGDLRHVRRYLCKWCGYYIDADGPDKAVIVPTRGFWTLWNDLTDEEKKHATTPNDIYNISMMEWKKQ